MNSIKSLKHIFLGLVLISGAALPQAGAQDLLGNGTFNTDVSGWYNTPDGSSRFDFLGTDGTAPSGNGCAEQGDTSFNGGISIRWNDTHPTITPNGDYEFSLDVKKPAGSMAYSNALVRIQWLDDTGSYFGLYSDYFFSDSSSEDLGDGNWHHWTVQLTAPADAYGAVFNLGVPTPSSGSGEAVLRWDNVVFNAQSNDLIFSDGFETSGTSQWSSTTP